MTWLHGWYSGRALMISTKRLKNWFVWYPDWELYLTVSRNMTLKNNANCYAAVIRRFAVYQNIWTSHLPVD